MNLNREDLQNTLRQVALPAMVGAAGTGALGAYMSRHPLQGETPSQRRHRIVRNALISASLGGMAGATLPTGLKTLAQPYFDSGNQSTGRGVMSRLSDAAMGHLGAGIGGGAAYFGLTRPGMAGLQDNALNYITKQLKGLPLSAEAEGVTGLKSVTDPEHVTRLLEAGPEGRRYVLSQLAGITDPAAAGGQDAFRRLFQSAEMVGTAANRPVRGSELRSLFGGAGPVGNTARPIAPAAFMREQAAIPGNLEKQYLNYLSEGAGWNPIRRLLQGAREIAPLRGLAGRAAEAYSTLGRPEAARVLSSSLGRFRNLGLGRLGLMALPLGAAYLGSQAQRSLTGD